MFFILLIFFVTTEFTINPSFAREFLENLSPIKVPHSSSRWSFPDLSSNEPRKKEDPYVHFFPRPEGKKYKEIISYINFHKELSSPEFCKKSILKKNPIKSSQHSHHVSFIDIDRSFPSEIKTSKKSEKSPVFKKKTSLNKNWKI